MNVLVVGSVAFGAVFEVLEVDADMRTGWTWYEILRDIPVGNLAAYQQAVFDNPVPTKACTSGVAYTLGDFTCQLSQGKTIATVDLRRSFRSGVAGFLIHGPLCHYWLLWTEENLSFDGAWWATFVKVLADQTVWSLFPEQRVHHLHHEPPGYGSRAGDASEIRGDVVERHQRGLEILALRAHAHLQPHHPPRLQTPVGGLCGGDRVTILSAAVNCDAEKALQVPLNAEAERPTAQLQEQLEEQFSAEVSGVSMSFDKELLPSRDSADGIGSGCSTTRTPRGARGGIRAPRISGRRMETSAESDAAAAGEEMESARAVESKAR